MAPKIYFAVGSQNQVKIQAVKNAVVKFWPEVEVFGVEISPGIDQPKTDQETKDGAIKRAKEALNKSRNSDFGVGLESGIEFKKDGLWTFGWVAIVNKEEEMGLAKTVEFKLPAGLAQLIKQGMEQGEADAQFFKREDSGKKEGTVGLLTKGRVKRVGAFSQAIIFALIPFLNPRYYK